MKKTNLKELKRLTAYDHAKNITRLNFKQVNELRENEKGLEVLEVSSGLYGINGALLEGNNSKQLYVIIGRSPSLLMLV